LRSLCSLHYGVKFQNFVLKWNVFDVLLRVRVIFHTEFTEFLLFGVLEWNVEDVLLCFELLFQ
ncbi:MAG: hypothetical protein RR254_05015, partial [Muribaculaceae bacterium]